jgi:hypothetical protein
MIARLSVLPITTRIVITLLLAAKKESCFRISKNVCTYSFDALFYYPDNYIFNICCGFVIDIYWQLILLNYSQAMIHVQSEF